MQRVPEPELMDAPDQVEAYASADFEEPNQRFVDQLLNGPSAQTILTMPGTLVDLGCGPGDICLRLARALPGWKIIGIDAGENMLNTARTAAHEQNLSDRVIFRQAHLPDNSLPRQHCRIVTSNSLLHHLPEPDILWQTIHQIAAGGAAIQIMDLERPESDNRARELVRQHAWNAPEILQQDFFNSLKAAWTLDEIKQQVRAAGLTLDVRRVSDRHWMATGSFQT